MFEKKVKINGIKKHCCWRNIVFIFIENSYNINKNSIYQVIFYHIYF